MITAFVLMNAEIDRINSVAEKLAEMEGVAECYSVAGRYDLVAVIRVRDNDKLAEVAAGRMLELDGIIKSETLIAFRVHSRHDLEQMFSIGFEE